MIYTAITIGPIGRTFQLARSTKAIWSASYLFSYIMKELYTEIEKDVDAENILIPYGSIIKDQKLQAGLFPDRLIIKGKLEHFNFYKIGIFSELSELIATHLHEKNSEVNAFLRDYLVINVVEKEIDSGDVVGQMNALLDSSELMQQAATNTKKRYLERFFELKEYNSLIKDEFKNQPFPSLGEIATAHLVTTDVNIDDENYFSKIKQLNPLTFRTCHKYVAVVQADGDNMSKVIEAISKLEDSESNLRLFSKQLMLYSKEVLSVIKNWKGVPVYAGGDDLLFFAPVINGSESVIDLIRNIDRLFEQYFSTTNEIGDIINLCDTEPTMSYGVSITYHKFPMDQALLNAYNQLSIAKAEGKNAIGLNITKHSGQVIEAFFLKSKAYNDQLFNMLRIDDVDEEFISGFMYRLSSLSKAIYSIGIIEDDEKRNSRFEALFKNYFDEDIHQESHEDGGFLYTVLKIIQEIYHHNRLDQNSTTVEDVHSKNIAEIFAVLRFKQFITAKPK